MPIPSENKNSNSLEKKIISTLIFYKILNVPCLTVFEIYRYLIADDQDASLAEINNALAESSTIKSQNGFYWIAAPNNNNSTADPFEERIKNAKTSSKKIKKGKKIAHLLSIIPFVKSIGISGSVSMNGARPESDIDFFIISSRNRIWLTRLLTVALTQLIGQRRHKNIVDDKICLNIYIADEQSIYPIKNMANSRMILMTLPIYSKQIFRKFLFANKEWLGKYTNNFQKNLFLKNCGIAPLEKRGGEKRGGLLDKLEYFSAKIFSSRIFNKTPNAKPPYLVINDSALLFHYPRSKNIEVTDKYHQLMSQLN